ncbi:MAG TPA: Hsp20/alpha crystallin family protein [Gemmatimonadaceae bacterium]|nr:Hsp20/alpha crystallin family protein [Gemmatimonadaceae bacterium]
MARDTTQQSQRGQRPSTSASGARRNASGAAAQSDRQTPIQTGQEAATRGQRGVTPTSGSRGQSLSAPVQSTRYDPFAVMRRMQDDMDQLFSTFGFGRLGQSPIFGSLLPSELGDVSSRLARETGEGVWSPQIETFRRGDKVVVRADLPGVKKEDINVKVENDVLLISGERSAESETERDGWYHTERSYGSFYRAMPLPEGVSGEQCEANFKDGVLEVTLPAPAQESRQARKIAIK